MPNRRPVIVIDPGHGGGEKIGGSSPNNAAGANGLLEKNLTLDIARRMASVLKDSARVLLTRNDDVNLSLAERANLARRNDAAIFLSLHFNGFKDRNVDGAETFVASRAGASSERLARQVLDHLVNVTQGADRGVKRADLGVLLPDRHLPQTAACLAEIAFLTNPAQAKKLEDAAYRQQIAAALGDAILKSLSSSSFSVQSLPFDYENGHSDSRYFQPPDYYALGGAPKFDIKESVGKGGANKPGDVFAVKQRLIELGFDWITLDKKMDAETIHAIRLFQSIVNDSKTLSGDGKIDVGANTYKWLQSVNAPRWRKMPKGSAGEGFVNFEYDDENIHIYGTDWLADTIAGAGIHYRDNYLKSHPTAALLTVNDASLAKGGSAPPHSEHQTGMDCDLRLPRTDGKTGGINIGKPAELLLFDRDAARAMLQALKAQPLVSRLLFNDQTLIDEGLCKKSTPDHNHHIHVDISPPAGVNDLKHYRSGGRLYQGSHQDDIDYQTHALDANCDNSVEVKRDEKYLEFALMSSESDRPNKKENVFLRWCDIPKNRCEVDVVVHFHGWDIRAKKTAFFEFAVKNSGLDLFKPDNTPTRQRPTLCILPFGKGEKMPAPDNRIKYSFPFLTGKDGLQRLIDFSLKYLAARYKSAFTIGRLILTAHSGGGAAVSSILQKLSNGSFVLGKKDVDEIHLFDSTYGDQQRFVNWATNKINTSETSAKSGALRILYQPFGSQCNESGTTAGSRQIEKGISDKIKKYPDLNLRYRVQPTRIEHLSIPKTFGFQLLANASADLDDSFVNKDSVHPCCQKSPAKCGEKEPVRPQSLGSEGGSPAISNTARLEWQDLTMAPGSDGQNHLYYLTSGGPEGSPAIFNLKITNTNSVYNLENAVLKVRLSKKLSDGSFKTISMRGQTGEYKSIRSQSIEDESSRVIPIKIERETLLNAYKADPDSPFTRLDVEFHWTEGDVSPNYHYNRHSLAFFLVRPFEFLFNTKKLVRDVKLNDLQYRSFWTGIWEKEFSSADQTPLTVVTTIQTSVSESGTDEITMTRSTTETKGVQRGVESSYSSTSKASFGLEDVVKIGLEQQDSVSVKASINRSESIARQFSESLRSSRAFTQAFTKTLQVTSQISPAGDGKIKTLYIYPIFDLYKVKLVRYEGPNRLGQATRRTEIVDVPILLFSHWGDKQVQTDANPARGHSLAASSLSAEEWLPTVRQTLEQFLYRFANMTVNVSGSSVAVRPPYFIKGDNDRKRRALENRRNAPREDKEIFEQQRFAAARVGKPSINQLQEILQLAIDRGRIVTSGGRSRPNADDYRQWLVRYGLGIDCSGFVTQALNQTSSRVFGRDLNKSETLDPDNINSAALKGGASGFTTVARPDQLRPGDTMHKPGHIRVVTRVEITDEGHVKFTTAESSSVNDIGPTHNVWRYRDRSQFSGLQKESNRDWNGSRWKNVNEQDTFGRYALLARFIEANPVARAQSHVWRDKAGSSTPVK